MYIVWNLKSWMPISADRRRRMSCATKHRVEALKSLQKVDGKETTFLAFSWVAALSTTKVAQELHNQSAECTEILDSDRVENLARQDVG